MAKKKTEQQSAISKRFLVTAGAVLGVAVLGFVAMSFVGKSDDTQIPTTTASAVGASTGTSGTSSTTGGASTSGTPSTAGTSSVKPPENKLTDGGDNPFTPKLSAGGTSSGGQVQAAASQPSPVQAVTSKLHAWQLLTVKDGKATFLVDGKKKAGIALKGEIIKGYTFNSVAGSCVTVKKGTSTFGLCPGAQPFSA
jgi:hypothetical protein